MGQHGLSHQVREVEQDQRAAGGTAGRRPGVPEVLHRATWRHPPRQGPRTPTAWLDRGDIFLDIFAGAGGIGKAIARCEITALAVELALGLDIFAPGVLVGLLKLMRLGGKVQGIFLATPCRSFSLARRAPRDSPMPSAVRSPDCIWGFSNLSEKDKVVCQEGNRIARATCRLVRQAIRSNIPFVVENPASSMLWHVPYFRHLIRSNNAKFIVLDQSQFGADFRKRTGLLMSVDMDDQFLSRRCSGKAGICSRSGRPHEQLEGSGPDGWKTDKAKHYTLQLCSAVANTYRSLWARKYVACSSLLLSST